MTTSRNPHEISQTTPLNRVSGKSVDCLYDMCGFRDSYIKLFPAVWHKHMERQRGSVKKTAAYSWATSGFNDALYLCLIQFIRN